MSLNCVSKNCRKPRAKNRTICHSCAQSRKREKDPVKYAYFVWKNNAKRRRIRFEISLEYFRKFAYEVDLTQRRGRVATAYHIDRIIDALGYVEGNLAFITCHDNVMKEHERRRKMVVYDWQSNTGGIIEFKPDNFACPF